MAADRCTTRTIAPQDAPVVVSGPTGDTDGTHSRLSVTMNDPETYGLGETWAVALQNVASARDATVPCRPAPLQPTGCAGVGCPAALPLHLAASIQLIRSPAAPAPLPCANCTCSRQAVLVHRHQPSRHDKSAVGLQRELRRGSCYRPSVHTVTPCCCMAQAHSPLSELSVACVGWGAAPGALRGSRCIQA